MAVFVHASVNRSHPCEIRHSCLYLCLTPCRYLPLCCRHVVTGTFGMLLPSFSGSFTSWSCHHCIAHLNVAVFSCTTTCNLVSSCLMFYSPWHTSFNVLLMMNRILLACDYSNAPLLSNPMRVLFSHRFSPFEFSERSESQLLFPTQS